MSDTKYTPEQVIQKIKSKGYWEVNIHPETYKEKRIEKEQIRNLIKSSVVRLSGSDFPAFSNTDNEPYNIANGIEKAVFRDYSKEFWRMTQSSNFFHLIALWEDWRGKVKYNNMWSDENIYFNEGEWLGVLGALFRITQIFEFAKRLASQNIFDENVLIDIKLHGIKDRILVVDSFNKVGFRQIDEKKATGDNTWSYTEKMFSVTELLNKADELALKAFQDLVFVFNWDNPPMDSLKDDQRKFLEGRI